MPEIPNQENTTTEETSENTEIIDEAPTQEQQPSSSIEAIPNTQSEQNQPQKTIIEPSTLKEDMNIIETLQTTANA